MYSEIVILAMLRQRPRHGYEIKKDVERALGGMVSINNKTLYPTLKHFEEMGAVVRQVMEQEGKPNRHLYHLTERGIELMNAYLRDFPAELAGNKAEFLTRLALFGLLEPQERQEILKKRLAYIENRVTRLQTIQQMANEGGAQEFPLRVLDFEFQQARNEYQWLANLLEEVQASINNSQIDEA